MKKSLVILTALSLAPLCGAQNPEVVPMPAEMAAAVGLAQQEADIRSALALLPRDTESYLALGNLPGYVSVAGMPQEMLGEASVVESAAVAFGGGSAQMLRQALPLCRVMAVSDSLSELASGWASAATEQAASVIKNQEQQQSQEAEDKMIESLAAWHTAPVYAVLTVREEGRAMLPALQQNVLAALTETEGAEAVEQGAWKGARFRLPEEEIQAVLAEEPQLTALRKAKLEDALRRLQLQVVVTVRDHALVVALCSDPAELHLPEAPDASVAAGEKAAFLKAQHNPLAAAYLSPELINACRELNMQTMLGLAGFVTGVFKTLGAENASPVYQQAAAAVGTIMEMTQKHNPAADAPSTLLLWEDGALHLDLTGDANGARFAAAESVALPTNDKTFFTFTCDPIQGTPACDAAALLNACETLANGVTATLNPDAQMQAQMVMAQYHLFDSEKEILASACEAWKSAFTGSFSFVADAAGSVPASLLGGSPAETVMVPRVAMNLGVAQRADIEKGRSLFMQAVKQGMAKVGADETALDTVPMAETKADSATLYSLALPMCCPGFSPTVAVTDKTWSLSSSVELATAVAKSSVIPAAAEGKASFSFSPAPMAALLKAAAALDAENKDLADAAAAADAVSSVISTVSGTATTTADDLMHLRVDLTLKH